MTYSPGRDRVEAQAVAALAALENLRPGALVALRVDALRELAMWEGIAVQRPESLAVSGPCQVAGSYRNEGGRAVLTVSRAGSRAREQFTVLHELGHHIQRTNRSTSRVLAREPMGDRQLEERTCEVFAARILLPDELVTGHIGTAGPTASAVVSLMEAASASRSACCVAAARQLVAPGHVLLLDKTGSLLFAASVALPRPAGGSDQGGCSLVRLALSGRSARVDDARLSYQSGDWYGEQLFGDASWHGDYMVAVLTTDRLPWGGLAVRPGTGSMSPVARMWHCAGCALEFPAHQRCPRCHEPKCPDCGHCDCIQTRPTQICARCFISLSESERLRGLLVHEDCP